ncbi:MAG: 1-acyl-sn-glycerol-3-phosphate acyltransferase [Flavobacteriaceae bacterium]|nr:1-acyl-sn-glycerol-3-phosphate acyltransferase [Flavobacteriaceae bacterium]
MKLLKKIISYPLSVIFYACFGLTLLIFHPLQWLAFSIGGIRLHAKIVYALNFVLLKSLHILGAQISFKNKHKLPKNTPLIIVSNHQSLNDITALTWYFRKHSPKFVSKKELEKGIPSVSFNLRNGGSALIDRKDTKQALSTLKIFGQSIEQNNYSAVIFPEGTRSIDGKPKRFSENGLKILVKYAPSAFVVPVTINNSWKFLKYGAFPMEIGVHLQLEVHEPVPVNKLKFSELFERTESSIKKAIIS